MNVSPAFADAETTAEAAREDGFNYSGFYRCGSGLFIGGREHVRKPALEARVVRRNLAVVFKVDGYMKP